VWLNTVRLNSVRLNSVRLNSVLPIQPILGNKLDVSKSLDNTTINA